MTGETHEESNLTRIFYKGNDKKLDSDQYLSVGEIKGCLLSVNSECWGSHHRYFGAVFQKTLAAISTCSSRGINHRIDSIELYVHINTLVVFI